MYEGNNIEYGFNAWNRLFYELEVKKYVGGKQEMSSLRVGKNIFFENLKISIN